MSGFLKGTGSVLLTLLLALGWSWVGWLRDQAVLSDRQSVAVLVLITLLLTAQQIYFALPRPADKSAVEARRPITQDYLSGFLGKYYARHPDREKDVPLPVVRVNVMLPTKRLKGLFGTYLKIYYNACPNGIVYGDDEREVRWKSENGTCGWAWAKGEISIYDSEDSALSIPASRLTDEQENSSTNINSTLSIPIWYNGHIVGVLSLDSKQNVSETYFNTPAVVELASGCARIVAPQCFSEGVAARTDLARLI